jgi:hypothetical protein
MATETCLWGAPRIHGELLKLGFTVSERTVSRYMPDRRKALSQSWRTFLANEFGQLAFASTLTSSDAAGGHDVADARVCRFAPLSLHSTGGRSHCRAVAIRRLPSLTALLVAGNLAQDLAHHRTTHVPLQRPLTSCVVEVGPNACGWVCLLFPRLHPE